MLEERSLTGRQMAPLACEKIAEYEDVIQPSRAGFRGDIAKFPDSLRDRHEPRKSGVQCPPLYGKLHLLVHNAVEIAQLEIGKCKERFEKEIRSGPDRSRRVLGPLLVSHIH